MGAVSSCCAVEEGQDRQVMKESPPPAKDRPQPPSKSQSSRKDGARQDGADRKEEKRQPKKQQKDDAAKAPEAPVNAERVKELRTRLQSGLDITVLLQDGTKLSCTLHLNPSDNSLSISCEDKVRVIPLSDVKSLLHTRDQLKRVETRANLVDDENCVALHLLESGNCIPLRFADAADKATFVDMLRELKSE